MRKVFLRFVKDNAGAASIEYALIAGFVSILIIAGVNSIGTTVVPRQQLRDRLRDFAKGGFLAHRSP